MLTVGGSSLSGGLSDEPPVAREPHGLTVDRLRSWDAEPSEHRREEIHRPQRNGWNRLTGPDRRLHVRSGQAAVPPTMLRELVSPPEIVTFAADHEQITRTSTSKLVEQVEGGIGKWRIPGGLEPLAA
jgi:hypothetical protein